MTRADLLRLVGRHEIRRRPRFGPTDRPASEPVMRPTHGLTPVFLAPGPKRYVYFGRDRVAVASWSDDRPRVPVTWLSYEAWRALRWPNDALMTAALASGDCR